MGLGKTMQALIAARLLWRDNSIRHILIICPKSLVPNWKIEIDKWWHNALGNLMVYDTGQDRQWFLKLATKNVTVKLINYEALPGELEWLRKYPIPHDLVIIDEAQQIKNAETKTAQCVKHLRGQRCWALTGTPLENRLEDIISIFDFVRPGLIQSATETHVAHRIRPFMLRRRTDDSNVKIDLPDMVDQEVAVDLGSEQRDTYRRAKEEGVVELNAKGDSVTVTHVFQLIHRLRQICNFDPGSGLSAKLELLREDFEEIAGSGKKALVFSQFTSDEFGVKRLARELGKQYKPLELHGDVPQKCRELNIETFQNDPSANLFLLNYQVGGLGLNLQAATYVYLFDRWWNPAMEDQAVKRAHRIGQKRTVIVRRFYCRDTIEQDILQKLAEKRRLFRAVIDENRPAESMGLTEEELFSLFDLKVRPRRAAGRIAPHRLNLDSIDPGGFEELVARLYVAQGFDARLTGGSHDGGIDILAEREAAGGRDRIAIQCKRHVQSVGRPVLQQLWGVVSADPSFTRADVVTTSGFSSEARAFADGKRVTLIDREALVALAREYKIADL